MTGNDLKRQAKAEAARKKAALACAKKLEAASDALREFMRSCNECNDASRVRGEDDSRMVLQRSILEYAGYISSRYEKNGR